MSDPWTNMRKARVSVETGLNPDRYRFVVHPESRPAIHGALKNLGVPDADLELFHVHDSEAVDLGQVLVMDTSKIVERMPMPFAEGLAHDPGSEALRRETRRLLSEHITDLMKGLRT